MNNTMTSAEKLEYYKERAEWYRACMVDEIRIGSTSDAEDSARLVVMCTRWIAKTQLWMIDGK